MNKELSVLGITISILLFAITTSSVTAQNATTNASNAIGNVSAPQPANQTAEREVSKESIKPVIWGNAHF
jgi:hypothetical protein